MSKQITLLGTRQPVNEDREQDQLLYLVASAHTTQINARTVPGAIPGSTTNTRYLRPVEERVTHKPSVRTRATLRFGRVWNQTTPKQNLFESCPAETLIIGLNAP